MVELPLDCETFTFVTDPLRRIVNVTVTETLPLVPGFQARAMLSRMMFA